MDKPANSSTPATAKPDTGGDTKQATPEPVIVRDGMIESPETTARPEAEPAAEAPAQIEGGQVYIAPLGVELADIDVAGDDLLVKLPHGDVIEIANGAVDYPFVQIDGMVFPLGVGGPAAPAAAIQGGSVYVAPESVALENVDVDGDDLVITLPNGEEVRIEGGALQYQFIEIDGLIFPLAVGGPEAAAGSTSSGGNFVVDPGNIDPAFDITDLLPPTALAFGLPEQEELIEVLEVDEDSQPLIVSTDDANNDEDGLGEGGNVSGGGINVDFGSDGPADSGELVLSAPGLDGQLTAGGAPVTFTVDENGDIVGSANGEEIIRISITGSTTNPDGTVDYEYTVTLSGPVDHPDPNSDDDVTLTGVTVTATDSDGDTASGTFDIVINDSVPAAADDPATQSEEGAPITIDVFANDTPGADGVDLASDVESSNLSGTGTLTYNGDGTFTYEPGPGEDGQVTFDYTITDGDGDTATATVTIDLQDDSEPVIEAQDGTVDEAALDDGSNPSSDAEQTSGGISIGTGGDTVASLVINGVDVTGGGVVDGAYGTLTVTETDGVYTWTYTLDDNTTDHPDDASTGTDEGVFDQFDVVVTDSDGDEASDTLDIAINDDGPTALDDLFVQDEENAPVSGNVLDNNGSGADTPGADDPATVSLVDGSLTGAGELTLNADGSFTYEPAPGEDGEVSFQYTLTDADGDESVATATIELQPDSVPQGGESSSLFVDEDDLVGQEQSYPGDIQFEQGVLFPSLVGPGVSTDSGSAMFDFGNDTPDDIAGAAVLSADGLDGQLQTPDGDPVTFTVDENGELVGSANGEEVIRIAITGSTDNGGGSVTYDYEVILSAPVEHSDPNSEDNEFLNGVTLTVTDSDGDSASVQFDVTINDDVPEAFDDSFTQSEENADVTGNVLDFNGFGVDAAGADGEGAPYVELVDGSLTGAGDLTLNADGSFNYEPGDGEDGVVTFDYTITDGDGDTSQATVTIDLQDDSEPVIGEPTSLGLDEDGFEFANDDDTTSRTDETAAGENLSADGQVVVDYGSDVPADAIGAIALLDDPALDGQLSSGGQSVTFALDGNGDLVGTIDNGDTEVIRISITGATDNGDGTVTYDYTATLSQPLDHDSGSLENIETLLGVGFEVTDGDDGDTAQGSFDVSIVDDVPQANDDTVNQADQGGENTAVSGNVIDNDAFGADGDASDPQVSLITDVSEGDLQLNSDGSFTFIPAAGQEGSVEFTYQIVDQDGDVSQATATINLEPDSTPEISAAATDLNTDDDDTDGGVSTDTGSVTIDYGNDAGGATFALSADGLAGELQTLDGQDVVFAIEGGVLVGRAQSDDSIVIEIEVTNSTPSGDEVTYDYKVTQHQPLQHADPNTEDDDSITVSFTGADGDDGDEVSGTFDVTINDDVPEAFDDSFTQSQPNADVTGNVLDDNGSGADTAGADGEGAPYVELVGGSLSSTDPSGPGTLTLNDDGSFTYEPADGEEGSVSFDYTITDADGDTSQATATITLQDDDVPVVDSTDDVTVDEDGFEFANDDDTTSRTDETDSTESLVGNGQAVVTFASDVPGDLLGSISLLDDGALDGQLQTLDGDAVNFSLEGGDLVGRSAGDDSEVIRISITDANVTNAGDGEVTYDYAVTLSRPVEHVDGGLENIEQLLNVGFEVTDSDSDTAQGSFDVSIVDDVPQANDDSYNQADQGGENTVVSGNVIDNDAFGADGDAGDPQVSLITDVSEGDLQLNSDGSFTFIPAAGQEGSVEFTYQIVDQDGDVSQATASITLQPDSTPEISAAATDLNTDDDDTQGGVSTDTGSVTIDYGNDSAGATFALSDAGLAGELQTLDGQDVVFAIEGGALVGRAQADDSIVIEIEVTGSTDNGDGTVTYDYEVTQSQPLQHADPNTEDDDSITVQFDVSDGDDGDALAAPGSFDVTINDDVPEAFDDSFTQSEENADITGNVLADNGNGADSAGADGEGAPYVEEVAGSLTGAGTLTLNADGSFTYEPAAGEEGDQNNQVTFDYTITDGDGDVSQATATITLQPDSTPEISAAATDLNTDDDDTQGGVSTDTGSVTIDYGNDSAGATFALSDAGLAGELQTLDGQDVVFAIEGGALVGRAQADDSIVIEIEVTGSTDNGDGTVTYDYEVTQSQPLQHADPNTEDDDSITVQFDVSDGDDGDALAAPGSFDVTINDDVPEAFDDSFTQSEENADVTGNVLADNGNGADSAGADAPGTVAYVDSSLTGSGDLTLNPDGSFTYEPAAGEEGQVSFQYTLTDADGDADTATATIDLADDSTPIATANDSNVDEDGLIGLGGEGPASLATDSQTFTVTYYNDVPANALDAVAFDPATVTALNGAGYESGGDPVTFEIEAGTGDLVGSAGGSEVIRIHIANAGSPGVDGAVTYTYETTLSGPLDHPLADVEDDVTLSNIGVIATDSDGDTANTSFDVTVNDDIPESLEGDVLLIQNKAVANTSGDLNFEAGADGIGEVVFTGDPSMDGTLATDVDGNTLFDGGEPIFLYGFGTDTLVGRLGDGGAPDSTGDVAFTITLDPDTGTWSAQIDIDLKNGTEISVTDLTSVGGGNSDIRVIGADDADNNTSNFDVVLDGDPGSVNTSADGIGVGGGQSFDAGESVQMEFVTNAVTDGSTTTGFAWDSIVEASAFRQEIQQVQGNQSQTTSIRVTALATDGDQTLFGDPSDTVVEITDVKIYDALGNDITDSFGGTITLNGDGTASITGLQEGEFYEIHTDELFSGVKVASEFGPGDSNFDLGVFSIFTATDTEPFDLNFDITGTDADGDSIGSALDLRISPDGNEVNDFPTANDDFVAQDGPNDLDPASTLVTVNAVLNDAAGNEGVNLSDDVSWQNLTGTGTLTYNGDGTFTYEPGVGESGTVSFEYTLTDTNGDDSTAIVTIDLDGAAAAASTSDTSVQLLDTSTDGSFSSTSFEGNGGGNGGGQGGPQNFSLDAFGGALIGEDAFGAMNFDPSGLGGGDSFGDLDPAFASVSSLGFEGGGAPFEDGLSPLGGGSSQASTTDIGREVIGGGDNGDATVELSLGDFMETGSVDLSELLPGAPQDGAFGADSLGHGAGYAGSGEITSGAVSSLDDILSINAGISS
ncbi:hypothetical protein DDZ18_03100 [Marinicauda salina]|uniref:DUF5801 domain-containing protein n=2 Tax=Marinicauda salina TaxID=2135793 RepID=A0A2U2BX64_9PROT|nr:hypothetical protein DDZ18_03100 [Marinicauda salina]